MGRNGTVRAFFEAKSVCVVGASETRGKPGRTVVQNLLSRGFAGKIYPVNPSLAKVAGLQCYPTVHALPEVPDLSVVAIPAGAVPEVMTDHARKGIRSVIILSGGFRETGRAGQLLEDKIRGAVRGTPLRIIGPNCLGIFDNGSRIDTFFVPSSLVRRPFIGDVSLISQSGSFAGHLMDLANSNHLGMAKVITYGNRIDVNEADCIRFLADDPHTKVVGMYIEGVENGRDLLEAFLFCTKKRNKPLVVLKGGKNQSLNCAVTSHTGILAGEYAAYRAAFREAGAYEVQSIEEMVDSLNALVHLPASRGDRVAILSHAGGLGLVQADLCIRAGLSVPTTGTKLQRALKATVVPFASVTNPIDLTASGTDNDAKAALELSLVDSDHFDIAIYLALWGLPQERKGIAGIVSDVIEKSKKPIVVASLPGRAAIKKRRVFDDEGIPVFLSLGRAAKVAKLLALRGRHACFMSLSGKAKKR